MHNQAAKSFQDLIVWQKAHHFVLDIYSFTSQFPKTETFGLTAQFRKAAISIAANIAEGFRKRGKLDKIRFFNISEGSLEECRYYLLLARDLNYGNSSNLFDDAEEISKLLQSYSSTIRESLDALRT
jgi:four helix bundle protein